MRLNQKIERAATVAAQWWTDRLSKDAKGPRDEFRARLHTKIAAAFLADVHACRDDQKLDQSGLAVRVGSRMRGMRLDGEIVVEEVLRDAGFTDAAATVAAPYQTHTDVRLDRLVAHFSDEAAERVAIDPAVAISVPVTYQFTEMDMRYLVMSAVEGGISYWCKRAVQHKDDPLHWTFTTHEGEKHELTRARLIDGLAMVAKRWPHHLRDLLAENEDAGTADAILQAALFGDIVYC